MLCAVYFSGTTLNCVGKCLSKFTVSVLDIRDESSRHVCFASNSSRALATVAPHWGQCADGDRRTTASSPGSDLDFQSETIFHQITSGLHLNLR